jgi:ABC-type antimicrobial peptide transport system permease subunit
VLAGVLRVVAAVNGLICLYALVQALALTAVERRQALAVLRAAGAARSTLVLVLAGAGVTVAAVAGLAGTVLERLLLAPLVANVAAGYASLPLGAGSGQVVLVLAALLLLAAAAAVLIVRRIEREPIVVGLRGE